jgi:hypothetical protein
VAVCVGADVGVEVGVEDILDVHPMIAIDSTIRVMANAVFILSILNSPRFIMIRYYSMVLVNKK